MSAHTPGPWAAHPQALLGVHQPELQCWIPQNRADAMLIAAAPDLLEALRVFVSCASPVSTEIDERGHRWIDAYLDQALPIARAAIAQATGGAA